MLPYTRDAALRVLRLAHAILDLTGGETGMVTRCDDNENVPRSADA